MRTTLEAVGIGCGIFALILVLLIGSVATVGIGWGFDWVVAPFKGALSAREKIQGDGDFRIQAYTKFYNDCASIQALETDWDAQNRSLAAIQDPQRREIIELNKAGISAARDGAIRRYNTDSHKQWTEAQFKSTTLAYELSTGVYTGGNKTVCVVQ